MNRHFLLLLLLASSFCIACRPSWPEMDELIKDSKGIYAGYVVGVQLDDFENLKREEGLITNFESVIIPENKTYTIAILETLKGKRIKAYDLKWKSCGNGLPELRDKVILYKYKYYNVVLPFNTSDYEKIIANKAM